MLGLLFLLELLCPSRTLQHLGHVTPANQLCWLLPNTLLVAGVVEEALAVPRPDHTPGSARHRGAGHRPRLVLATLTIIRLDILLAEDCSGGLGCSLLLLRHLLRSGRLKEGRSEGLLSWLLLLCGGSGMGLETGNDHTGSGIIDTNLINLPILHLLRLLPHTLLGLAIVIILLALGRGVLRPLAGGSCCHVRWHSTWPSHPGWWHPPRWTHPRGWHTWAPWPCHPGWRRELARWWSIVLVTMRWLLLTASCSTFSFRLATCSLLVSSFIHLLLQLLHFLLSENFDVRPLWLCPLCCSSGCIIIIHFATICWSLNPDLSTQINANIFLGLITGLTSWCSPSTIASLLVIIFLLSFTTLVPSSWSTGTPWAGSIHPVGARATHPWRWHTTWWPPRAHWRSPAWIPARRRSPGSKTSSSWEWWKWAWWTESTARRAKTSPKPKSRSSHPSASGSPPASPASESSSRTSTTSISSTILAPASIFTPVLLI